MEIDMTRRIHIAKKSINTDRYRAKALNKGTGG